jgi:hypothetical protein
LEGLIPPDSNGNSTNNTNGLLTSGNDQAEPSAGSIPVGHAPIGDDASQGEQLGSLIVTTERGDDGAEAEVRANGDQLHLPWSGEEQPSRRQIPPLLEEEKRSEQASSTTLSRPSRATVGKGSPARPRTRRSTRAGTNGQGFGAPEEMSQNHPTPDDPQNNGEAATIGNPMSHRDEEAGEPAMDAIPPIGVSVPANHVDSVSVELRRCGWCDGTQFSYTSRETGQIYCTCGSIYRPSSGIWDPGDRDKRHSPPVSEPATDCAVQGEIERGPSEAMACSPAGDEAFGDQHTARQTPPARSRDEGETNRQQSRERA